MSTSDNDGTGDAVAQRTNLKMANSDQPGSQLVTAVFDGENFLSWSKSTRFALGAKSKLGLITGSSSLPATNLLMGQQAADISLIQMEMVDPVAVRVVSMISPAISMAWIESSIVGDEARELWFKADFMIEVFDPGGFKITELELLVALGAHDLFDGMLTYTVLVCELRFTSLGSRLDLT